MHTKIRAVRSLCLLALTATLVACASAPKVAFKPELKQSIKKVALVETPEPRQYFMNPGQAPGGAALYMFGALGGAILGSIEANRFETASTRFNAAVAPLKPELSATMLSRLEKSLAAKGYEVVRIPTIPNMADGKEPDFSKIEGTFDAVLITTLGGGYSVESGAAVPNVRVVATLHSRSGTDKLFSDGYIYGTQKVGQFVEVLPDPRFTIKSIDAVYDNLGIAVDGLRTGADKLAERVAADF